MKYQVNYTVTALDDLDNIYSYIAFSLMEPKTAIEMFDSITKAIRSLEEFPLRNPRFDVEPHKSLGLRKMPVKNYLVFYTADEEDQIVNVLRIMYGGQDIVSQL